MGDGNIHDGSALFFALYDTIEGNETEKLWCQGGTIYTPDANVFDAIQKVFNSIGVGSRLVTGYYNDNEQDIEENPCYLNVAKQYCIDID